MGLEFKLKKPVNTVANEAIGGRKTMLFAANEAYRLMNPFVPMDTGTLADTVGITATETVGTVHYKVPYASRQYYAQGRSFRKHKHPMATAYWDHAMKQLHGDQYIQSIQAYVKKKG